MQPTAEIESFISRIVALPPGPGVSLDGALQPSLDDEVELRKLFATDRKNERLVNPHVGLLDVFAAPDAIRTTRARVVAGKEDLSAHYVMPIQEDDRRKEGSPAMVADLEEFKKNWAIFTEGSLSQLIDWNNVVASGGSVLACLTPLENEHKTSKRAIRKFYHSNAYPTSDVDIFLWGLTAEQAEAKIKSIYEAVRDSVPWDVTCIRTKHTVSIHSQYPYRSVQIVLRLYQSPAEILAGFDIDAPCCAYDGQRVWANPRAVVAMMRQCNTVDMTRRSPSYEIRLAKYSRRAYEVYVPALKRGEVDPTIFERAIARMEGLARLLVLEKLADDGMRTAFLQGRRQLRGRPNAQSGYHRQKRRYKGDLKEETGMGIEINDYDVASLHIPYGPGWDARRIDKLVYQTDLGMNSTFNPKNKGRRLHRHPAFFGTIEECLEDCCEHCPKPVDDDERKLKEEEDEKYINGRIKFIEENPGRQSITGSFNPIDVGEWSGQVYIKPMQQFFTAIAARDRATVKKLLEEGIDVNQRDYVGRTSLHVAICAKATDIAGDLIDAGARVTARLADGRAPLHLAAQHDEPLVIGKLLKKSAENLAEQEKAAADDDVTMEEKEKDGAVRPSSEDDWSSHDDEDIIISGPDEEDEDKDEDEDDDDDDDSDDDSDGNKNTRKGKDKKGKDKEEEDGDEADEANEFGDTDKDQPDIIEVDALDWDIGFSALAYAVIYGSLSTLNALIDGGADPKGPTKQTLTSEPLHPLTLTLVRADEDEACAIAERLIQLPGVSSSTADEDMRTIFHKAVAVGRTKLVETLLRCDPHASTVLDFPSFQSNNVIFPVVTAIKKHNFPVLGVLLAYGAKLELTEQDVTKSYDALSSAKKQQASAHGSVKDYLTLAYHPVETAVSTGDDIANLLVALGATIDIGLKRAMSTYVSSQERRSLADWFDFAINELTENIKAKTIEHDGKAQENLKQLEQSKTPEGATGWKAVRGKYLDDLAAANAVNIEYQEKVRAQQARQRQQTIERFTDTKEFLRDIRATLTARKAKTWNKIYPTSESAAKPTNQTINHPYQAPIADDAQSDGYVFLNKHHYRRQYVPKHLVEAYDQLYEACYTGDNAKVQQLCLPVEGQDLTFARGGSVPLNISVRQIDNSISSWDGCGYTPLFAAIHGRRWSTAKLILAIATAQYAPEDEDEENSEFKLDLDDESEDDSEEYDSDASEVTIERQEIRFVDIATRPSTVKSETHPKFMLQDVQAKWAKPMSEVPTGPRLGQDHLLAHSVVDDDLEAFVQICKLYDALPEPLDLCTGNILHTIFAHDRADILDEYIRRSGDGIDIEGVSKATERQGEGEVPVATNDASKTYLGLSVHGKKRKDLASKNDPNAVDQDQPVVQPLLWRAAAVRATKIMEYLASDRPFAAYKLYATTHSDSRAIWFKRLLGGKESSTESVLERKLPAWMGWTINSLGESPLAATIAANNLGAIKLVARLQPTLFAQALQTKIKFAGANMINLAIGRGCDSKIVNYLLSRKVSATERLTSQGWNVYHQICARNDGDQLEHLLKKLPKDVTDVLLTQQSKVRLNTPLHIAASTGAVRCVKILLEYSQDAFLMLNIDGQTPLHMAAEKSFAECTKLLLAAAPPAAMYMEDCVGNTVVEGAELRELGQRVPSLNLDTHIADYTHLGPTEPGLPMDRTIQHVPNPLNVCVESAPRIADMFAALGASQGRYRAKVHASVTKWAEKRAPRAAALAARKALRDAEEKAFKEKWEPQTNTQQAQSPRDRKDVLKTIKHIREAVAAASAMGSTPPRRLIHLFEVQQSVAATLSTVRGENKVDGDDDAYNSYRSRYSRRRMRSNDIEGELEEEESEEKKERRVMRSSVVLQWVPTAVDPY